ncbi:hypothetical protein [Hydrogenophaga sp. BPS33]|uniref:hypothetical protein n=1 Tax=Hydrogenophaga sp. BPS33 TaxID=2651974 RepID=UPI00131F97E1|nr:hypothetical protein [Hydrogenophaga sp. BPS33]QHE87588.1 hypothetical protein F9K07_23165 [Hydrogenophaga sp. BPS33]
MKSLSDSLTSFFQPALPHGQTAPGGQTGASSTDPDTKTGGFFTWVDGASASVTGFANGILAAVTTFVEAPVKSTTTILSNGDVADEDSVSVSEEEVVVVAEEKGKGNADHPGTPGRPALGNAPEKGTTTTVPNFDFEESASASGDEEVEEAHESAPPKTPRPSHSPLRHSQLLADVYTPDAIDTLLANSRARRKEAEQREATQRRIDAIVRWWKHDTSPPQEMLKRLEIEMVDLRSVAVLLKKLCGEGFMSPTYEPAVALVIAATNREDRSLHSLINDHTQASRQNATKGDLESDLRHVRAMLDACVPKLNFQNWTVQEAFSAMRVACPCPPSRLRSALAVLQNASTGPAERTRLAREFLAEIRYSNRDTHGSPQPMTLAQYLLSGMRSTANGLREGKCHYAARIVVQGGALYLLSGASLPLRIGFAVLGTGLPQLYACWRLYDVESSEYKADPSKAFTLAKIVSVAGPLLFTLGPIAAGGAIGSPALMSAGLSLGEGSSINAIGRVLRQAVQSWSMSSWTAGISLVHTDGIGLSADEQRSLNCVRDALYTATSILLLVVGPTVTQEWLKQSIAALKGTNLAQNAFLDAVQRSLYGGLNEMCDGWNPDVAKVACKLLWGREYIIQPGTQRNPGKDPQHFFNQTASRQITTAPSDILSAAAHLADEFGAPPAVGIALRSTSALFTGLWGSLRGRVVGIVNTTVPIDQEGSRNPSGLLSTATKTVQSLWRRSPAENRSWMYKRPAPPPTQSAPQATGEDESARENRFDISDSADNDNDADNR